MPLPTLLRLILTCLPSWCPQVPQNLKAPLPKLHRCHISEAVGVRSSAAVPVMTKWTLCSENKASLPCSGFPTLSHPGIFSQPHPGPSTVTSQYSSSVEVGRTHKGHLLRVEELSIKYVASLPRSPTSWDPPLPHYWTQEYTAVSRGLICYIQCPVSQCHIPISCRCIRQIVTPRGYRPPVPSSRSLEAPLCKGEGVLALGSVRHCLVPMALGT